MKIGDYVRTKYGIKRITDIICGQDIRFDNTDGFDEDLLNYHDYDGISKNSHTWEEIVIGEPKEKIIELIEVGDYVNNKKIVDIGCLTNGPEEGTKVIDYYIAPNTVYYFKNEEIKSIVTKEQFSQMEYKIGD